jgi:hypothetical protein
MFTYFQSEHLGFIAKTGNFEKWKTIVNRNKSMLDPKVIEQAAQKEHVKRLRMNQLQAKKVLFNLRWH